MPDNYASRVAGMASQTGSIFPFRYRPGPPETTTGTDESGRAMTFQSPRYEFAIPGMVSGIKDMLQIPGQTYAGKIAQSAMPDAALRVAEGIMTGSTIGARPPGSLGMGVSLIPRAGPAREATKAEIEAFKGFLQSHAVNDPDNFHFMSQAIQKGALSSTAQAFVKQGADGTPAAIGSISMKNPAYSGGFTDIPVGFVDALGSRDPMAGLIVMQEMMNHALDNGAEGIKFITKEPERYRMLNPQDITRKEDATSPWRELFVTPEGLRMPPRQGSGK